MPVGYCALQLYKGGCVKLEIGLAKGKKEHDKRATEREKDSKREAAAAMKKERR
jgi:SsrA-binding protein